jgi:lysozyme
MFNRGRLRDHLVNEEGYRKKPYVDTVGKVSIGVGRNLTDKGLSVPEIELLLNNDITETEALLDARLPWWRKLDDGRQMVLMDMAFNMGGKLFTFVNTLAAIKRGDWAAAAAGMKQSKWAQQVGDRAVTLARIMEQGDGAP